MTEQTPPDFLNPDISGTLDANLAVIFTIADRVQTSQGEFYGLGTKVRFGKSNFAFISGQMDEIGAVRNPQNFLWYIRPEKQSELANRLAGTIDEYRASMGLADEIMSKGKSLDLINAGL